MATVDAEADGQSMTIGFPDPSIINNLSFINKLVAIINAVYHETDAGIFIDGYERTTPGQVACLLGNQELATAILKSGSPGSPNEPIGCVLVKTILPKTGMFGLLALEPKQRGGGVGKRLAVFAEEHCQRLGCTRMQLELLVPTGFKHPFKERLEAWYTRMGYAMTRVGSYEEEYPELGKLLAVPVEYRIYEKPFVSASCLRDLE